ncbi:outer membrane protein assembly factor BamE [Herminiimonas sp. CN]|uniref:outer membrane protein assembly factor BamE domain-containing protein n=1 Tax=Herminiimonas sp. CN TaxID=1349818 RepID=UPI000473C3F2|nr:outer membrane protein assembly factor BamE [Herminiimonas sp. CN]
MNRWIRAILALGSAVLAVACDQQGNFVEESGLSRLAKGISGESDVRMAMGQPDTVWEEEDGARTLEYPKGPMGHRTWMFAIDKNGKLQDYRQVLTEANFANVRVGMSKEEVRRLLGRPRTIVQFKLKNEEVWDWRYLKLHSESRFFNVHFDIDSRQVIGTSTSDDQPQGR